LEPLLVPHFSDAAFDSFLADVIQKTKDRLNELTEDQKAAVEEQTWFRDTLPKVDDADGINGLIDRARAGGKACSAMVAGRAKELGLIFDKKAGAYAAEQREAA